jgi:hypothetical protein
MNQVILKSKTNGTQVSLITADDLEEFRVRLLEDIKQLLAEKYQKPIRRWIKSREALRMLTIAPITLQRLRDDGTLPFTRFGRTIYYDFLDIEEMLLKNKQYRRPAINGLKR